MKTNPLLSVFKAKAKSGEFLSFDYAKSSGEKSHRVVRIGVNLQKRFEKEGTPLKHENGKGNWISQDAKRSGRNGFLVKRGGKVYLSATDCSPGQPSKHKVFDIAGISNIK